MLSSVSILLYRLWVFRDFVLLQNCGLSPYQKSIQLKCCSIHSNSRWCSVISVRFCCPSYCTHHRPSHYQFLKFRGIMTINTSSIVMTPLTTSFPWRQRMFLPRGYSIKRLQRIVSLALIFMSVPLYLANLRIWGNPLPREGKTYSFSFTYYPVNGLEKLFAPVKRASLDSDMVYFIMVKIITRRPLGHAFTLMNNEIVIAVLFIYLILKIKLILHPWDAAKSSSKGSNI